MNQPIQNYACKMEVVNLKKNEPIHDMSHKNLMILIEIMVKDSKAPLS